MRSEVFKMMVSVSEDHAASTFRQRCEGGGIKVLQDNGVLPHHYMASQSRRP
jgi:hypothetical protein